MYNAKILETQLTAHLDYVWILYQTPFDYEEYFQTEAEIDHTTHGKTSGVEVNIPKERLNYTGEFYGSPWKHQEPQLAFTLMDYLNFNKKGTVRFCRSF